VIKQDHAVIRLERRSHEPPQVLIAAEPVRENDRATVLAARHVDVVAPEDAHGAILGAFRTRAHFVDESDGFIDLQVWQSERDASQLIMASRWRDRAAFRGYMRREAHQFSHRRIDPSLDATIKLERLEHLHTSEVVAD
jgi:heme-degrading monooxygenase HmoA